jgi:CPA2 family monovalent cation:H+ antiporter-2
LSKIAKTRSQELFTIAVLVMAFTTAVAAAFIFQASLALGAFLGGMVVGRSKLSHQAAADLLPLRDTFAVLFFLSVGMLLDPRFLLEYPILVIVCIAVVLIIKPLTALIVVTFLGYSPRTSLVVAMGLAQVGEFSFILAQEASRLGLADARVYNAIVITAIVSITLNPTMFKRIPKITAALKKNEKVWEFLNYFAQKKEKAKRKEPQKNLAAIKIEQNQKTAIVVGFGPTGQNIAQALIANNIKPVIIDMNIDTVINLTKKSISAVYGDCSKKEVLQAAGIAEASYLIITIPLLSITTATAALAAILNPQTRILARSRFLNSKAHLKQIGIAAVAFEEEEVSKGLTNLLLEDLEKQKAASKTQDE